MTNNVCNIIEYENIKLVSIHAVDARILYAKKNDTLCLNLFAFGEEDIEATSLTTSDVLIISELAVSMSSHPQLSSAGISLIVRSSKCKLMYSNDNGRVIEEVRIKDDDMVFIINEELVWNHLNTTSSPKYRITDTNWKLL